MPTKMIIDTEQVEDEFWAAYDMHSLSGEANPIHINNEKGRIVKRITDKRFHSLSLFSKFHSTTPLIQISIDENPVAEAQNDVDSGDSRRLPYPAFSSPLEDISFDTVDSDESSSHGDIDQSKMTELEGLFQFHDTHVRRKTLFAAWDTHYVLRPPSSPIIRDADAKRKWFH